MSPGISKNGAAGIALLYLLIFWAQSWEHNLGMDSMTFASLAKRIWLTADWKTLHYSSSAYQNFYMPPPGLPWIGAIFFRLFGATEFTAMVVSSLFQLGTLLGAL